MADEEIVKLQDKLDNLLLMERLLRFKLNQQVEQYKTEEEVTKERAGLVDVTFNFTEYGKMKDHLDLDIELLGQKFMSRKKGSITEIQAKQQWEIKQLEQKMALTETNPDIVYQVNILKHEVGQLTYQVDKELILQKQLQEKEFQLKQEIQKVKLERKQKAEELFQQFKQNSIKISLRVQAKPRQFGNPKSPLKAVKKHAKIDNFNYKYEHLHDECNEKIRIYKEESRKLLGNVQQFTAKKAQLEAKMKKIVVQKGLKYQQKGFLELQNIENAEKIMEYVLEEDAIDDLVWLCLIEDVYGNLNAVEVQQRIGLESQCNGLRKKYGVVYDK